MVDIQSLLKTASEMPVKLSSLAEQLEKGQAVAPLQEQALKLNDFPRYGHELTLVLVGMTNDARSIVLNWLIGPQHQSVSVKLSEPLELLEIRLQERGYALETDLSGRREYANPEEFLNALTQKATAINVGLLEPIKLSLAAPAPLRNLTLLTPANASIVSAVPRLLSTLASRTTVLVLAAPAQYPWSQQELESISMISENVLAVWPIVTSDVTSDTTTFQTLLKTVTPPKLPQVLLAHSNAAPIPNFIIAGPNYPLRIALMLNAYAHRCRSLLEMINERFEADLRQMESRHKREARLERMVSSGAKEQDAKTVLEPFKSRFTEEIGHILQTLRENTRRSLLKSGDIGLALEQLLTSLQPADLERELGHKIIRLSLKAEVLKGFKSRLARVLRHQVDEDCILIRDSLDLLRQDAEKTLSVAGATTRSLSLVAPDNRQLWESLGDALQLDIRYRGELPRRGFFQRLAEGRRIVFVVMMLLSLVGGFAGFNVRQIGAFGFVFLFLFIGAVIYTYTSWHKEEGENLDKEIDKVRENMQTEFSRALNEILRDKQTRLQQLLDELKREGLSQLDNAMKEALRNQALNNQNDLRDAKSKLRVIDQRLKELKPTGQSISHLAKELDLFNQDAKDLIRQLSLAEATL